MTAIAPSRPLIVRREPQLPERSDVRITLNYLVSDLRKSTLNPAFLIFIIGMPAGFYLMFSSMYGKNAAYLDSTIAMYSMSGMAAYAAMSAAMFAGARVESELRLGWFRQLMLTALRPSGFVTARIFGALGAVVPSLFVLFALAAVRGDIAAPVWQWVSAGLIILMYSTVFVAIGMVIGLLFKPEVIQAATVSITAVVAVAGGLWFPVDKLPFLMRAVSTYLPSYWMGVYGRWPFLGGTFPVKGLLVFAVWATAAVGLVALLYPRAMRKRR